MEPCRIMLMSGYLGSGKTTSMTSLAKYLTDQGRKVCLITNDLGSNLVDTAYVAESGIPVLEISNGCLCHDVPQLLEKIDRHVAESGAEFVIFEPVGSCVDMVDHVYRDIAANHREGYTLAPVSAIVDPRRFRSVYLEGKMGENIGETAVAYGFQKQLEEADLLLLNKIDLYSDEEIAEIHAGIEKYFPGVPVIEISGLRGYHMDQWADYVLHHTSTLRPLEIDTDLILKGCEDMGWYNKVSMIEALQPVNMREVLEEYLYAVQGVFQASGREILHAKVHLDQGGRFVKSALTSTSGEVNSVGSLTQFSGKGTLNVNIRALMLPKELADVMESQLEQILAAHGVTIAENALQSFLPVDDPPAPRAKY